MRKSNAEKFEIISRNFTCISTLKQKSRKLKKIPFFLYKTLPKGRTMGEIVKEDFNIEGLYLGASSVENSDPVPETMPSESSIIPGFEERPPLCPEMKGND